MAQPSRGIKCTWHMAQPSSFGIRSANIKGSQVDEKKKEACLRKLSNSSTIHTCKVLECNYSKHISKTRRNQKPKR